MPTDHTLYPSRQSAGRRVFQILLAILMFVPLSTAFAQPSGLGPNDPGELAAFVDGVMAAEMASNHIPGAVVSVVKDGQVLFAKGYGYADQQNQQPVDPATTLFRPGSISKLFTWTAVMQLVEQGQLSLDADVNTYLDFKIPATFSEPITLKNLMTHTPGFEDQGNGLFKLNADEVAPLDDYLKQNLPARVFPPGKLGAYSNYGAALAGYIVERVSGLPFNKYVEKNIFVPLKMSHSSFQQPLPAELAEHLSGGYNFAGGVYRRGKFEYVVAYPAGGLSASALDIAHFMIAHLQNGRYENTQILKDATARQMHSPLFSADPRLGGMAYGFFENTINGQYVISHGGDTVLFHSGLFLLPEQNMGLFVSTNGTTGGMLVENLQRAFLDRYYPPLAAPVLKPTADFSTRAAQYAGSYTMSRSNFTSLEKLLTLTNAITVSVDEENHVLLAMSGDVTCYVETEPGLLVNPERPRDKLVMSAENGQVYLFTPGPFVFIKTPAQGQPALHLLIFGGGALLFLLVLITWTIDFFRRIFRREPYPLGASLARLAGWLFGLGFLVFLVLLAKAFTSIDPTYGIPAIYFNIPVWMEWLLKLPLGLGVLGLVMLVFSGVAWWRRYWNVGGRLSYTFVTLVALAVLWALNYWNLLVLHS